MKEGKPLLTGIKSKVIAASLLACFAIFMALVITYFSFHGLLNTVDALTKPNQKLATLNSLYRQVTQLDQLQRAAVIHNPQRSYSQLLRESKPLLLTLDSLRMMSWGNEEQVARLDEIEQILHRRDRTLLSYLKLKSEFVSNKKFSERFDSLASLISWSQVNVDSSVTTTERRTVTTTHVPPENPEDDRSLLNKLFGGKKKEPSTDETRIEVTEELRVRVDTLATAKQDSAIVEIGRIMKNIQQERQLQNQEIASRELALINTNRKLIQQILSNVQDVEQEERAIQNANNQHAAVIVNESVTRIGVIMIISFLLAAVLVFLIIMDVTRSNMLRRQLILAKNEAERLSQIKQRFLANMSHELRTPLQSIIGFAEQLKYNGNGNNESVDAIYSSSEHLLHIVNEVLDFSKIESGKFGIEREVFDMQKVIHEVESAIRIQADKKGLRFNVTIDQQNSHPLIGDPFRLRQILYNLLGNAVKFTEKGYVKLNTIVEDETYMVKCIFQIIDSGIGMDQDEIEQVFQLFEQGKKSTHNPAGGTGLGLTIARKLVEAQNGKLSVSSEPGSGSVFTVELHFDKAPHTHQERNKPAEVVSDFNGTVMIVDDDTTILSLCKLILDKHNITSIQFSNPEKALECPVDDTIKFILLDIRMPKISGVDLCKAFRKRAEDQTKIIALTAHVLPQEKSELMKEGFDRILTKPFREADLLDLLGVAPKNAIHSNGTHTDMTFLNQLTLGDETLLQSVLIQFIEDTTEDLEYLEKTLSEKNASVREPIHRLAGRTGQIGFKEIAQRLRNIEKEIVNGVHVETLRSEIEECVKELELLVAQIKREHVNEGAT